MPIEWLVIVLAMPMGACLARVEHLQKHGWGRSSGTR